MKDNTAILVENSCCAICGWPVIVACCNDEFKDFKDAAEYDRWYYCSNKGCKNHTGEGSCQETPDFVNSDATQAAVDRAWQRFNYVVHHRKTAKL